MICRLLTVVLALGVFPAQAKTDFTPERLWQLSRLNSFEIAPDGRTIAAAIRSFDFEQDGSNIAIWLFDTAGSRPVRALNTEPGSDSQPAWHPDGRQVFFLRTLDGRPTQLYQAETNGTPAQALTDLPVPVRAFRVVEDGRAIIFEALTWPDLDADFAAVQARRNSYREDKTQARISETRILRYWDRYLTDGTVPHLFRLDIASGAIVDLTPGFDRVTGMEGFEWDASADGRRLVYSANSTLPPYRELDFDLFLRDLDNGGERNLTADNRADDVRPVFSADGRRIAYGRYQRPATGSDLRRLALLDLADGSSRILTGTMDGPASDWRFDRNDRSILFHADSQGQRHLYRWRGGRVSRLARGGLTEAAQAGAQGIVYANQDFGAPADLWHLRPGLEPRRITAINDRALDGIRHGRYDSVRFTGNDGQPVQMFVAWPPGERRGRGRPAIILNHGGPFTAWTDSFSHRWHPGLFAARGYVVALPNFHGSTGFGQDFADSILGNHGEKPVADTLAAADWLVANAGVDPDRIAIAGGSYGGYLTALLTGMSDRFRAAIVHAGVYDIGAQFASDMHWSRPAAYGDAPWTDPTRLNTWSPSRFVPAMNTPTLILHGERDYRVPVTQGINLHGALTGKGVPSRIVIFPRENHWIQRPQAAMLWWHEVFAWLDRHNPASAATNMATDAAS